MKEKRRGPMDRAAGVAEGVAAVMRRMQRDREPRVLLYDAAGYARLLQPQARGYDGALAASERMVRLVIEDEA